MRKSVYAVLGAIGGLLCLNDPDMSGSFMPNLIGASLLIILFIKYSQDYEKKEK